MDNGDIIHAVRNEKDNHHSPYQDRIETDTEILVGKPVIKRTRIPVELILKRLSQDLGLTTLFESYPRLTEKDAKAALAFAQAQFPPNCTGSIRS